MQADEKEKILREVERFLKQGMLDRVEALYRKILTSPQIDTGLLNRIGDLFLRHGNMPGSIRCFKQLAEHYETKGFEPQAAAIWKKVTKISQTEFEAHYRLARLYEGKKLIMDAKRNYVTAAKGFHDKGDYKSALKAYEKLQILEPNNLKLKEERASILIQLGQYEDAANTFVEISQELENSGNIEDSIKTIRRAASIDPKFLKEIGHFIRRLCAKEMMKEAMLLAEDLFLSMPERGETGEILANLFMEQKNYSDARNILNKALESKAENEYLIKKTLGKLLKEEGDRDASFAWYCKAADDCIHNEDYEQAAAVMNEYIEGLGDDVRGLEKLVEIYKSHDDQDKALQYYKRLEGAYLREGDQEKASFIRQQLGEISAGVEFPSSEEEEEEEAAIEEEEVFVQGAEKIGTLKKEEFIDEQLALFRAYSKYGVSDKAVFHLEQILNTFPEEYEIAEQLIERLGAAGKKEEVVQKAVELATFYKEKGKKEKAASLLRKALEIDPTNDGLNAMLEELGKRKKVGKAAMEGPVVEEMEIKIEEEREGTDRITTVEEMLQGFREKVKQDVPEDDYKTHYELGIAYKEMNLINEAISEFEHAQQDPEFFIDSSLMLSICLRRKGEVEQAGKILEEGIHAAGDDIRGLDLKYELADIYHISEKYKDAFTLLKEIVSVDPSYRDATNKLQSLLSKIK